MSKHNTLKGAFKRMSDVFHSSLHEVLTLKKIFHSVALPKPPNQPEEGVDDLPPIVQQDVQWLLKDTAQRPSSLRPNEFQGKVAHVNARFAFVVSEERDEDIWVATEDLKYAIDGDQVIVRLKSERRKRSKRVEGFVTKIIQRSKSELVGRIEIFRQYAFVVLDNKRVHTDIFVHLNKIKNARNKDKVLVKIKEWHSSQTESPMGEVVRVLGQAGKHEVEMHSIMSEFGLPLKFPKKVWAQAEAIPEAIPTQTIRRRKDLRKVTTFTIDPYDAKDFDDAISIRPLKNGNHQVGVHIADVSHYIPTGSALDIEAARRATSVYLVDRTVPMLPEKLSNGICSLRPQEDKLTFSIVFEMTPKAEVKKQWIGRSIIRSNRRFTYEEAQQRIEKDEGDFHQELTQLNDLAKRLKIQRFEEGSINFETVEVKFKLDKKGKPIEVLTKERKDAHKLVEEFMLLANKRVAEWVHSKNKGKNTFVYRTHDLPDPEKLATFAKFSTNFGYKIDRSPKKISHSLNALIDEIAGKPEQNVLETLAIRSMAKAIYTTEPKSHFGLAFPHYTHFTSPIRRYPDLMVHRLLQHYLDEKPSPDGHEYQALCRHASTQEKKATDAERASIKFKQVEFMSQLKGMPYQGIISGVSEWGIFVEIVETKCEGMIRLSNMLDDFYEFDEKNFRVIGRRKKRMYTLGSPVTVRVTATDITHRTIDLVIDR